MHSRLIPLQKYRNGMETSTITVHATTSIIPLLPRQHLATILLIRETSVTMACCTPLAIRWITRGIHPHHSRSLESSCQSLSMTSFRIPLSPLHTYIHVHHHKQKNKKYKLRTTNSIPMAWLKLEYKVRAAISGQFFLFSVLALLKKNKKYKLQITNSIPICVISL